MTDTQTGRGFCLVMQLRDPSELLELMQKLEQGKGPIQQALGTLDYVHYARFLPLFRQGVLLIVTEFDGEPGDYVMDFAAVLNNEFSMILGYMTDHPPLPVADHPIEFWDYVKRNSRINAETPFDDPFSPYPDKSVLDIVGPGRRKTLPPAPKPAPVDIDLCDVQANVLLRYRAPRAHHVFVRFPDDARAARAAVQGLLEATPHVTSTEEARKAGYCLNLGFTHKGLEALGLSGGTLGDFPQAFREGPRERAERLGDVGDGAPENWRIGGYRADPAGSHGPDDPHAMLSLYAPRDDIEKLLAGLREVLKASGVTLVGEQPAASLGAGKVHFGYRDGLSQPRIAGIADPERTDQQPALPPGDFLLGDEYTNSRGGRYIGRLPSRLVRNATYVALRLIRQQVGAFETLLDDVAVRHDIDPELVAAKLMGRWRDGSPLIDYPEAPGGGAPLTAAQLDGFDYIGTHGHADDNAGLRCPMGSHTRRLNPRGGMAVGVPWGKRVLRRGMPYGTAADDECGLVGLFLCADLESQFEFLQRVWANKDLSAPGLRGTRDPIIGSRTGDTPFRFRPTDKAEEVTISVPPLTRTVGSLYLLMPGMASLRWIANEGWNTEHKPGIDLAKFDPTSDEFRRNPYPTYEAFRREAPIHFVDLYQSHWVFSHALVKQVVSDKKDIFLKPGKDRAQERRPFSVAEQFGDGLFFMDPPRHTEVRAMMEEAFAAAIQDAGRRAREIAEELLDALATTPEPDMVQRFANPLPTRVFMDIMGIRWPKAVGENVDGPVVDIWVREALKAHSPVAGLQEKLGGGTAAMALRAYFLALAREPGIPTCAQAPSLMAGMQRHTGCPASAHLMDTHEAMNTAVQFSLGGYLSTEFLITTGLRNLLLSGQWAKLKADRTLLPQAVHEMLRYDAPFQMADRWVAQDTELVDGNFRYPFKRNDKVTVVYGSANRDQLFPKADTFDVGRPINDTDNFGFGHDIHYCIGAPLARAVAAAAFSALLDRYDLPEIVEANDWLPDPYFRSLQSLKVRLR
ncbi:MAG TPA: cytochrome P450 [Burkholderiaceae bacterium]|nr:cytochrome P450 [Burkholderiaceae bacterium]